MEKLGEEPKVNLFLFLVVPTRSNCITRSGGGRVWLSVSLLDCDAMVTMFYMCYGYTGQPGWGRSDCYRPGLRALVTVGSKSYFDVPGHNAPYDGMVYCILVCLLPFYLLYVL
jgi:hypothetical protein